MSDLRTAALRAPEALEAGQDVDPIFAGETEDALRAALAESDNGAVYWYVGTDGKYYSSNEVKLFMDAKTKTLFHDPPKWLVDKGGLIPLVAYRPDSAPIIEPEIKDDKPFPPPEAQTEAEKIAYCAGWWDALEAERKELLRIAEKQQ